MAHNTSDKYDTYEMYEMHIMPMVLLMYTEYYTANDIAVWMLLLGGLKTCITYYPVVVAEFSTTRTQSQQQSGAHHQTVT